MVMLVVGNNVTVKIRHLLKQDGRYYYQRRVPNDLRHRYDAKTIKIPLGADMAAAARRAREHGRIHDTTWQAVRSGNAQFAPARVQEAAIALLSEFGLRPGQGFDTSDEYAADRFTDYLEEMNPRDERADPYGPLEEGKLTVIDRAAIAALIKAPPLLLSQGLCLYLDNHKNGKDLDFVKTAGRDWQMLVTAVGDVPLESINRESAKTLRDSLLGVMKTASAERRITQIKAIFSAILRETNSKQPNPFSGLTIPNRGKDSEARVPFSAAHLSEVLVAASGKPDKLIIPILAMTGMRLAEAVGLAVADVMITDPTPHIVIRSHPWRSLKTGNSERTVPLIGAALDAARVLVETATSAFAFPRYCTADGNKADSASAALNKWIRAKVPGCDSTCHGFRHSLSERLRNAGVTQDVIDAIGGWAGQSMSNNYGSALALANKRGALERAYADLMPKAAGQ